MYAKIAILDKTENLIDGGAETVTIGFFDERGILQLQIPQISGKLFPKDMAVGKSVMFIYPTRIGEVKSSI